MLGSDILKKTALILLLCPLFLNDLFALTKPENVHKNHTLTIFIHGSILKLPILYNAKKHSPDGLAHFDEIHDKHGYKRVLRYLNEVDPQKFPKENLYMFAWCGSLKSRNREPQGTRLYNELMNVINNYKKKYNVTPKVRMITHSNGGSIALYTGKEAKRQNNKSYKVEELVMLACPVQYITYRLIPQRAFRKIFSIYSMSDWVQTMAPQSYHSNVNPAGCTKCLTPLFSGRCFPTYPNLIQAKIRLNNRGISHSAFLRHKFMKKLPEIINILNKEWEKPYLPINDKQCGVVLQIDSPRDKCN